MFRNSMFNIFLVNKKQLSKAIAWFSLKNVFKLVSSSISYIVFISVKTTSPHKGNLRAERIFFMPSWDFWCIHAPRQRNVHLVIFYQKSWTKLCGWMKWAFRFQMCTVVFVVNISWPSKGCMVIETCIKFFQPWT